MDTVNGNTSSNRNYLAMKRVSEGPKLVYPKVALTPSAPGGPYPRHDFPQKSVSSAVSREVSPSTRRPPHSSSPLSVNISKSTIAAHLLPLASNPQDVPTHVMTLHKKAFRNPRFPQNVPTHPKHQVGRTSSAIIVLGAYSNNPGNGGVISGGHNVVDASYRQQEAGAIPPLQAPGAKRSNSFMTEIHFRCSSNPNTLGSSSAPAPSPSSPPSPIITAAPPPTPSAASNNVLPPTVNGHASPPPQNGGPMYNWQATMTTVKERFAFLFNNEILSDVHFLVGKGESRQRIPAHKFVLAVGSAVFDAMFNGQLSNRQEEIELPDVEPQAFLALLRFLYSDEVQIGHETVMTVLYTAKKYAVPALEQACVDFLKRNLSHDNAFMLLTQARLFDEPQLAALCLETIDKNTADSLSAEGFTDIDNNTLCMVLERDTLRIREAKLFQAVVRWSEAECERSGLPLNSIDQRAVIGRGLSLVRFPLMTVEEFAQGPAQSGILTDREVVQLFLHFTVNPKPPVNFLDTPRCCMTGKEQTVCRFQQIESRWGYSGTSDRIRFIVDRRIFVVGFGMYGSIHGPSEYEVTIQIIHTATGKVCASNDTNFTSDGTVNTFRVMFKEPVEVLPNTNYTAYATLKGKGHSYVRYFGHRDIRKASVLCIGKKSVLFQ
ncbi:unnamed protein product, partial [Meganyctiphanes norvegica]